VKKAPSPLRAARQDQRIAVIEEIADDIYSVKFILQSLGYDVRSFSSKTPFLSLVVEFQPVLIIVDMMISNGGGYEVIRGIRARSMLGVSILAITAEAMEGEVEDVFQAGVQDVLGKPYTVSELQEKLETLFKNVAASPGDT